MSFREHVQRIVDQVPGATACCVMGFDGIAVDSVQLIKEMDLPTLIVEYTTAFQQIWQGNTQGGAAQELTIQSENFTAVFRPLTPDYFIAVVMHPHGLVGKARYLMRLSAPHLVKELT